MRRFVVVTGLALLASAFIAGQASAGKPDRQRLPMGEFLAEPGLVCPEAIAPAGVGFANVGGNAVGTLFDNGTFVITGRHPDEVTNVATGKSIVIKFQGRVASIPQRDGSTVMRLSGTQGFLFFPGDVGPGDDATGRSYVFTGEVELVIGALGSVIAFEATGTMIDTCAMIA
jgi:hypothetical protein